MQDQKEGVIAFITKNTKLIVPNSKANISLVDDYAFYLQDGSIVMISNFVCKIFSKEKQIVDYNRLFKMITIELKSGTKIMIDGIPMSLSMPLVVTVPFDNTIKLGPNQFAYKTNVDAIGNTPYLTMHQNVKLLVPFMSYF